MAELSKDDDYDPFTDEDMERVLREEKSFSAEDGWIFLKKDDLNEVWRKKDPNKPDNLIKGFINFQGIPPNKVADMIMDVEKRKEWDKLFPVIDVLETHKHYRVVYWLAKLPFGISDRDLVQEITYRYDEATNTTTFLYHNSTHPDRPERPGIIRAETIFSGVIVRPHPDDPKSTRMSMLFQQDMKGWIPHFIANAFIARAPGNWQVNLSDYYWNVYSKEHPQEENDSAEGQ